MAQTQNLSLDINSGDIQVTEFGKEMREDFLAYSMSVIVARALPDVRDGLKPVHRRILYAMNESGITPSRPHKKSAWTVGEVIGKYHPHGDSAVYETMVRLAQDFSMRTPLVDGHGNFGSIDGDGAAAMRYTEARLTRSAMELLRELDKDTVDWQPNYDESLHEPTVLPSRFPNLLVNGSSGIAVGMATNIPPHNLGETIDAVTAQIDNPEITTDELLKYLPGPDFPTGGLIMGHSGIRDAYSTGRGSIVVRAKVHVEQTKNNKSRLIVTEIPYQVNKSNLLQKIAELAKEKRVPEVTALRDESDRKGMRIVVELKQGTEPQIVLNKLYKHTQLQSTFGVINLALVDGVPKILTLKEILHLYIKHQEEVVTRRTKYDLKKAEERAHILRGLVIALDNIDEVIQIIRSSQDDKEAAARLTERFGLTEAQTTAILEMRLRRLTGLEREKLEAELAELEAKIAYFKELLADPKKIHGVIKDELSEIKTKYSNSRRTEITGEAKELDVEDLIADEEMVVTMTRAGYIKRLPIATYRAQKRGGKGKQGVNLKDNDFVEHLFIASTHDFVLFFTTKGKVYRLKVHEVPVGSRHARGTAVVNLLQLEEGEKVRAVITTREFPENEHLLFATAQGIVKKTSMSLYNRSRKDGIMAISLKDGDELIAVRRVSENDKVILVSTDGKAIMFNEDEVRPSGRNTMGVKGITLKGKATLLDMEIAHTTQGELLVITEKGYGKRTPLTEYSEHHRGGQGVRTIQMTEKKGNLAGMKIVGPQHELMIISEEGVVLRVQAIDVPSLGRSTQGVRIMNVSADDRVTALARMGVKRKKSEEGPAANQITIDLNNESGKQITDADLGESNEELLVEELISEDFEDTNDAE